ncbi:MAG: 3-oxoacyl-ACP synthase [Geobacteraceae bacterium GWC2_55_20]|nr:MAG: 3-oxoacyl-ACP synthase [Geobacteraceae bacterium GWC2_55_20]OGU21153.1 MAG: 3-oxoacyl-ACP synthase [Geobacteraceae bacterium GWF2_54_21]HBA71408.1 3-oxoacyl-ACP synthase [Geobacter sp.]HCE67466.1 3-oxoacyl-ACP synthase [Geobacter sp.]
MVTAKITGTGSALPAKILTNADLALMVDTSDEWITSRTGIKERRISSDGEYTSTLAIEAARRALSMASVSPEDLDLIILGTVTPDFPFPSTACIIQNELGAHKAVAFDVSAACSGFIYGLSIADSFIRSGRSRKALVIGAEVLSRIVDWKDRNTCILFGDGAGAAVIEASADHAGIRSTHIFSNGACWELLYQPGSGSRNPAANPATDPASFFIRMEGNEVYKHAVRGMEEAAMAALDANGISASDISLFIPHQANRRIIDAIAKRLDLGADKVFINLHRYGNTSSASIPIALDEANRNGRIKPGDLILLDAFGGGFTYGSALIRW